MKKELMNLFLFIGICFLLYLLFRNLNVNREGLTVASSDKNEGTSTTNGIAGNAATYAASIKSENIKHQDTFLISKYRSDYETAILNLDDLMNNLMLKTALSIDQNSPEKSIEKLNKQCSGKGFLINKLKIL
jgi:hypothetical protein